MYAVANAAWARERTFVVPTGTSAIDLDLTCATGETGPLLDFGVQGPSGLRGWSTARTDRVHIDAVSASFGDLPGAIEPGEWCLVTDAASGDSEN